MVTEAWTSVLVHFQVEVHRRAQLSHSASGWEIDNGIRSHPHSFLVGGSQEAELSHGECPDKRRKQGQSSGEH